MSPAASPSLDDARRVEIRTDRPLPRAGRPLPGARPVPKRRGPAGALRLPFGRTAIASALIIGVLAAFAGEEADRAAVRLPPPVPAPAAAAPPPWRPLPQAAPLYDLDGARFSARLHAELGREDIGALGAFGEDGPHLHLAVGRSPARAPTSLFVDLARRAGGVGIGVARVGRAEAVGTKFGPLEVAGAELAGERTRACLAFRSPEGEIGLRLAGWLCGAAEHPARPERLACLLDGLALAPAADDPALRVLFAQAEGRRLATCEPPRVVAALPAPERIPSALFVEAPEPGEADAAPAPARPRKR